jgi:hypothetical protein
MKGREAVPVRSRNVETEQWRSFSTSAAVLRAREQRDFIDCPVCLAREEEYLFHDSAGRRAVGAAVLCLSIRFQWYGPVRR